MKNLSIFQDFLSILKIYFIIFKNFNSHVQINIRFFEINFIKNEFIICIIKG